MLVVVRAEKLSRRVFDSDCLTNYSARLAVLACMLPVSSVKCAQSLLKLRNRDHHGVEQ